MRKKLLICLAIIIVVVLAVPVYNLIAGPPENRLTNVSFKDELDTRVAHIIATKCASCHTSEPYYPLYSRIPVVNARVNRDIWEASAHVDYLREFLGDPDTPVSEPALAKTEYAVSNDLMPPGRYLLLNWNHGLDDCEKASLLEWAVKKRTEHYANLDLPEDLRKSCIRPLMAPTGIDEAKAALGKSLFHDTRLSKDESVSCATCHDLMKGGCDQVQFSTGVGGAVGSINSPTVYNSGLFFAQFWDGRASDLKEQAAGPVENFIEMAGDWDDAAAGGLAAAV